MSDSLTTLEQQRSDILAQMLSLGDFRSGSITTISGRCGKASPIEAEDSVILELMPTRKFSWGF